jgi:hypothetical protein
MMQVNFNNFTYVNPVIDEFIKICVSHEGCKDCPMLKSSINKDGFEIMCETGRTKAN